MPAAAVIPAPIAYIKVVAVKKLVVGYLGVVCCSSRGGRPHHPSVNMLWYFVLDMGSDILP